MDCIEIKKAKPIIKKEILFIHIIIFVLTIATFFLMALLEKVTVGWLLLLFMCIHIMGAEVYLLVKMFIREFRETRKKYVDNGDIPSIFCMALLLCAFPVSVVMSLFFMRIIEFSIFLTILSMIIALGELIVKILVANSNKKPRVNIVLSINTIKIKRFKKEWFMVNKHLIRNYFCNDAILIGIVEKNNEKYYKKLDLNYQKLSRMEECKIESFPPNNNFKCETSFYLLYSDQNDNFYQSKMQFTEDKGVYSFEKIAKGYPADEYIKKLFNIE